MCSDWERDQFLDAETICKQINATLNEDGN